MTRDRMTYLAVGALLLIVGVWVARNTYWDDARVPMPPRGEAATNPYYSVQHLLTALGTKTSFMLSLNPAPDANGALLVDGFQGDMSHKRVDDLMPWVEAGGRLIITDDVVRADPELQTWSDIHRSARFDVADKNSSKAASSDPEDECSALDVAVGGIKTARKLTLCIPSNEFRLTTGRKVAWSLSNQFGMQVLRVDIGHGSVTVIPRFDLIANRELPRHDHAEIFIAAAGLTRGDRLYIVNVEHAEKLLAMVWRLAAPALVFFGLAILCIIVRELPQFGPTIPAPAMVRRSLAEQVRANAAFAWRTRNLTALRTAMQRALDETAKRRIVSYDCLDLRKRVDAIAARAGTDAQSLDAAMNVDAMATPHAQRAAISLLEHTRRLLSGRNKNLVRGSA